MKLIFILYCPTDQKTEVSDSYIVHCLVVKEEYEIIRP